MGGSIRLKSTVDIGSTFTLWLPLRYTKEFVPSVSDSIARPRAGSISSSVQFETFTNRSAVSKSGKSRDIRSPVLSTQNSSTQNHQDSESQLDVPRLVGFSQPYLIDQSNTTSRPGTPTRPTLLRRQSSPPANNARPAHLSSVADAEENDAIEIELDKAEASNGKAPSEKATTKAGTNALLEIPSNLSRTRSSIPLKVLVAEDNPVNQQVILKLLKLERVTDVTLAEDGEQAFSIVKTSSEASTSSDQSTLDSNPFSLIFMDIQMPRMDGIEATKKIRELGFDAPILALTAFDHETNRMACQEAGMNGFLPKPIKRTALKKVLEEYKPPDPEVIFQVVNGKGSGA
jgi:osomolarity two-component system, sensor histidine kinase SLN1